MKVAILKTIVFLILLSIPLAAQTRSELDEKYGSSQNNTYRIRPGISVEATFVNNNKIKTLRVIPDNPNDKNSVLNLDEARKTIYELVRSRMCFRPLRSSKITVACPPRKACVGIKEEWKSLTTLMVWHKDRLIYALLTLDDLPMPTPPGNIKLLPGYIHVARCGIDTSVGTFENGNGFSINYDIGPLAGNYTIQRSYQNEAEWTRNEYVLGCVVTIVLTIEKQILASYWGKSANFYARVKSQAEIDDFLKIVLTYTPTSKCE